MSQALIKDYLQTQGLRLPAEAVRMAHLASQAVVDMGQAEIDRSVLWPSEKLNDAGAVLADLLPQSEENERALKQVFMALDAAVSRLAVQSAAVYAMPSENEAVAAFLQNRNAALLRVAQQGGAAEAWFEVDEAAAGQSLAVRSAHTGWLNLVNDVAKWNADGELPQADARCAGVMTLPVCLPSGRVVGVVSVEADKVGAFDEEAQAAWVGVALALIEPLRILSGVEEESGDE